jgi:hypothetical protein
MMLPSSLVAVADNRVENSRDYRKPDERMWGYADHRILAV